MPRKALGPRPLTPAERQAHQRQKHRQQHEEMLRHIELLRGVVAWCVENDGETLFDNPRVLAKAKAALDLT